jgi:hypothetical protein
MLHQAINIRISEKILRIPKIKIKMSKRGKPLHPAWMNFEREDGTCEKSKHKKATCIHCKKQLLGIPDRLL